MERKPSFTDYDINEAGEKVLPTYYGFTVDVNEWFHPGRPDFLH